MDARVGRLAAGFIVALVLAVPASASGAVDIVGRGITPDPGIVNGTAAIDVDVKVGAAPYIIEFFCCDAFNTTTAKQTKILDENSPETQGLSGRHRFTFKVGAAGTPSISRTVVVRVTDSTGSQATKSFIFQAPTPAAAPPPPPGAGPGPDPENLNQCPTSVSFGLILARTTGGGCWREATRTPLLV